MSLHVYYNSQAPHNSVGAHFAAVVMSAATCAGDMQRCIRDATLVVPRFSLLCGQIGLNTFLAC